MDRTIVHVDMDAFYASCEIRENPLLEGNPVIIGGDPLKGRGVVITCSYEARKYGIHSAMPIAEAYKICPHGVYLRPHYSFYREVSSNVMNILEQFSDVFQRAGIDEAYMDASQKVLQYRSALSLGKAIQNGVLDEEKISCSVGIAPNKSVAKIASDFEKPRGITIVSAQKLFEFLRPLPVEKINGVGKKTKEILNNHGYSTIGQLEKADPHELTRILGKSGYWVWSLANGKDERPVGYSRSMKSVGKEQTFEKDTKNIQDIHDTVEWIGERLIQRLIRRDVAFRTITLKVRIKGFETYTKSKTLPYYTTSQDTLINVSKQLFEEFRGRYIRLIGIRLTNLREERLHQKDLSQWI
ncbi:MAG: DNA polymerase IV [Theionarchaea archaeon]|nr:DNA polymerase IV [Theionarchaea archaeon]